MMRMTNDSIPRNFKYRLMCLWHTFLSEHEVTNEITFSTVHALSLPGCLSTELVSKLI